MSIVDFNTVIWSDPWFRKLSLQAKYLFIYLWTNDHKNLAGLYPIAIDTICFETGIPAEEIEELLNELEPKIKYDKENEIVWIVNHVKHQFMKKSDHVAPTILTKLLKDLRTIPEDHPFKDEFAIRYPNISIEYLDTVSGYCIGKGKGKDTGKGKDAGKGKEEGENPYSLEEENNFDRKSYIPPVEKVFGRK